MMMSPKATESNYKCCHKIISHIFTLSFKLWEFLSNSLNFPLLSNHLTFLWRIISPKHYHTNPIFRIDQCCHLLHTSILWAWFNINKNIWYIEGVSKDREHVPCSQMSSYEKDKAANDLKAFWNQTILLVPVLYFTTTTIHVISAVICWPTMFIMYCTAQVKIWTS